LGAVSGENLARLTETAVYADWYASNNDLQCLIIFVIFLLAAPTLLMAAFINPQYPQVTTQILQTNLL
jgi:hypothetical protein